MMVAFFLTLRMFKFPGSVPAKATTAPIYAMGGIQATFMILMTQVMLWVNRRGTIAHEFLRPVSRRCSGNICEWRSFTTSSSRHCSPWEAVFGQRI